MFFAGIVTATVSLLEQYVVCLSVIPECQKHEDIFAVIFFCVVYYIRELSNLPNSLIRE